MPLQRAAFPDQPQQGSGRKHPAEIPLSGSAQPGGQKEHRAALQRRIRATAGDDGARIPGNHHADPDCFLSGGRKGLSCAGTETSGYVLCSAAGPAAIQTVAADDAQRNGL